MISLMIGWILVSDETSMTSVLGLILGIWLLNCLAVALQQALHPVYLMTRVLHLLIWLRFDSRLLQRFGSLWSLLHIALLSGDGMNVFPAYLFTSELLNLSTYYQD